MPSGFPAGLRKRGKQRRETTVFSSRGSSQSALYGAGRSQGPQLHAALGWIDGPGTFCAGWVIAWVVWDLMYPVKSPPAPPHLLSGRGNAMSQKYNRAHHHVSPAPLAREKPCISVAMEEEGPTPLWDKSVPVPTHSTPALH